MPKKTDPAIKPPQRQPQVHIPLPKLLEMIMEKQEAIEKELIQIKSLIQVQTLVPSQEIIDAINNSRAALPQ